VSSDNQCPLCPILEGLCKALKDRKCSALVEKLKKGEIRPEAFVEALRSKYPERRIDEALRRARARA